MKSGIIIVLGTLLFSSCTKKEKIDKMELETDTQKMYYSLGFQYGDRVSELSPSERELKFYNLGLKDGAFKQKEKVNVVTFSRLAGSRLTSIRAKVAVSIKKDAEKIINQLMKADRKYKKTDSGLVYKILKKGNVKKHPAPGQFVKIEFIGKHLNGKIFDKTSPQNIPTLPISGVIKAWREGLQLVGKGGEIVLIAPSHLAYGDAGSPPKIKGGESVIFEMKLVDVFKKVPQNK